LNAIISVESLRLGQMESLDFYLSCNYEILPFSIDDFTIALPAAPDQKYPELFGSGYSSRLAHNLVRVVDDSIAQVGVTLAGRCYLAPAILDYVDEFGCQKRDEQRKSGFFISSEQFIPSGWGSELNERREKAWLGMFECFPEIEYHGTTTFPLDNFTLPVSQAYEKVVGEAEVSFRNMS